VDATDNPPLSDEELAELPVFPLPKLVFFPGTNLPLHIFEQRYRDMVEDALSVGPAVMAVTMLRSAPQADYVGPPPIELVAGAGRIVDHESLPDGRHNIVLSGVARVRLDELPMGDKRYRRARGTVLPDEVDPAGVPESDRLALFACASEIVRIIRREHPDFDLGVSPTDPPSRMADTIADRFISDVALRQRLLETTDVTQRIRVVTDAVGELMAMLSGRNQRGGWVD
jgi:hypothetical protein